VRVKYRLNDERIMRSNFTQMYVHCVWATWDRIPFITSDIQPILYAAIAQKCKSLNCSVIAIGGIEDHLHLLVGFPPTLTVSELIKQVKGSSSHLITHQINSSFKWQGAYGAFTVSQTELDKIAHYICNQPQHHRQNDLTPTWELT
jgi:putative transposase